MRLAQGDYQSASYDYSLPARSDACGVEGIHFAVKLTHKFDTEPMQFL